MSTTTAMAKVWADLAWPADVKEFAAAHEAEQYLEPLRQTLARLFPTAVRAKVILEVDPELHDDRHIRFDVAVHSSDIPDYVAAKRAWHDELFRICPAPKVWVFRLYLVPLE